MDTFEQPEKAKVEQLAQVAAEIAGIPAERILLRDLGPLPNIVYAYNLQQLWKILDRVGVRAAPAMCCRQTASISTRSSSTPWLFLLACF